MVKLDKSDHLNEYSNFADNKLTTLWSSLNDSKRQIFTTDKFQREINPAGSYKFLPLIVSSIYFRCSSLFSILRRTSCYITHPRHGVSDQSFSSSIEILFSRPYTRTFIQLILPSTYEVRKQAYDIIRRLVNNLRSTETEISLAILNGLNSYLEHFQLTVKKNELNCSRKINDFHLE